MPDESPLICDSCGVALEARKVDFSYLGHSFYTELPVCPRCGQVFISEELARGRIAEVEMELEDK
ncbi:MAG TPA: hypothetical protein VMC79_13395 [Rectinemataceae bacterium]|nr:hypothetical protein [Rectinemataceae bacterium]